MGSGTKFKRRGIPLFLIFSFIFLATFCVKAAQGENVLGLDSRQYYDIYIGSYNDSLSVIRNVEIVGFNEVKNLTFLVIRTDNFEGKRSEGLIMLNYIRAILPSHGVTQIQGVSSVKYP